MATVGFNMTSTPLTGTKNFTGTDADMQDLLTWSAMAYQAAVTQNSPVAAFTGTISGTTLTVASVTSGALAAGQYIYGPGVAPGTFLVSGAGTTWTLNFSQTVATAVAMSGFSATQVGVALASSTVAAWKAAVVKMKNDAAAAALTPAAAMTWA